MHFLGVNFQAHVFFGGCSKYDAPSDPAVIYTASTSPGGKWASTEVMLEWHPWHKIVQITHRYL